MNTTEFNNKAIKAASHYLRLRGYEIYETSWECSAGTADIIARDGNSVVFCQVQARTDNGEGFPDEVITADIRKHHELIALSYMAGFKFAEDLTVRFDTLALVVLENGKALLRHHINALIADVA